MNAADLYVKLDKDFDIDNLHDDWSFMEFNDYICPAFQKKYMGLMLDNSREINKVYTTVFPDLSVIQRLIESGETDIMLFSHHAMGYDGSVDGFPFYSIPGDYLSRLRKQRISLYVLHTPLDKNGDYSTSVNLARKLRLEMVEEFCEYEGLKIGVICKTEIETAAGLAAYVQSMVGHQVKLRDYGDSQIKQGRVAMAAGGGSYGFVAAELAKLGINMFITGFTRPLPFFEPTMEFHKIARENGINVLGATHYTTEKYACLKMTEYFKKLGIPAEFVEGKYYLEDL